LRASARRTAFASPNDAYRQVEARLEIAVIDLGEKQLKNIVEPMRVYSLEVGVAARAKPAAKHPRNRPPRVYQ
jgi:adenylate cyclase